MKKTYFLSLIIFTPIFLFSQTKVTSPSSWKKKGDIEYDIFEKERDKEIIYVITNEPANVDIMYEALLNSFCNYIQADKLAQDMEDNGMGDNSYIKDISDKLLNARVYFINAGVYYNQKTEYSKASEHFEIYNSYPKLRIFTDERIESIESDSTNTLIGYYAITTAIQSGDSEKSIYLLNNTISDPYVSNPTFKESDLYELLANEYGKSGSTQKYIEALEVGVEKFPESPYFIMNLINEYIRSGNSENAFKYLDLLIKRNPKEASDYLNLKASLYASNSKYAGAEKLYLKVLKKDKYCERSLEGMGIIYAVQAQDMKEKASLAGKKKEQRGLEKKVIKLYKKSLPYLEKLYTQQKKNKSDDLDIRNTLIKLQNVYYNLNMLGVNKKKELQKVDLELDSY